MKLELGIIRSAFRGWKKGADIAPEGLEVGHWSIGHLVLGNLNYRLGNIAMASLTINGNAGNPTVSSTGPVSLV